MSQLDEAREVWRMYQTPEGRAKLRADYYAQLKARADEREKALKPEEVEEHARKAGCPGDALDFLRAGAVTTCAAMADAKRFCQSPKALFLLLHGPSRRGKTVAAAHVVLDFCRYHPWNDSPGGRPLWEPVLFVPASSLTRTSSYAKEDTSYLDRLDAAKLLVVDDMGDEGTDVGRNILETLLLQRHAKQRRSVLTSNLLSDPFRKRYGEALSNRIRESGIVPNLAAEPKFGRRFGE